MALGVLENLVAGYLSSGYRDAVAFVVLVLVCLLYTSDAADERSSVDLGGGRIIKKKNMSPRRGVMHPRRHVTQSIPTALILKYS